MTYWGGTNCSNFCFEEQRESAEVCLQGALYTFYTTATDSTTFSWKRHRHRKSTVSNRGLSLFWQKLNGGVTVSCSAPVRGSQPITPHKYETAGDLQYRYSIKFQENINIPCILYRVGIWWQVVVDRDRGGSSWWILVAALDSDCGLYWHPMVDHDRGGKLTIDWLQQDSLIYSVPPLLKT